MVNLTSILYKIYKKLSSFSDKFSFDNNNNLKVAVNGTVNVSDVHVKNSNDIIIDPATENTLQEVRERLYKVNDVLTSINLSKDNSVLITNEFANFTYRYAVIDNEENISDGNLNSYGFAHDFSGGPPQVQIEIELNAPQKMKSIGIKLRGQEIYNFNGGKVRIHGIYTDNSESLIEYNYIPNSSGPEILMLITDFTKLVKKILIEISTENISGNFTGVEIYGIIFTKSSGVYLIDNAGDVINPATEDTLEKLLNLSHSGFILNGNIVSEINGIYAPLHDAEKMYDSTLETYGYVLDNEITHGSLFAISIKLSKLYRANSVILVASALCFYVSDCLIVFLCF
jgi:uncharacterized protein YxjI